MICRDRVLSVGIDRGEPQLMRELILARARAKTSGYACFANVHMLYQAWRDPTLAAALEASLLVAPDGMPLARLLSWVGASQERLEGMSIFPWLLRVAADQNIPVALFGADQATLEAVQAKAASEFPSLRVVLALAPEVGDLPLAGDVESVRALASSGAELVFVALGCPKQELWMARYSSEIPAVLLGIGNAMRIWLGWERRAPIWMRRLCLEWLARLVQDPRRLWRRYLVSNVWFLTWVVPITLVRRFGFWPKRSGT